MLNKNEFERFLGAISACHWSRLRQEQQAQQAQQVLLVQRVRQVRRGTLEQGQVGKLKVVVRLP